jgi:hypothetical protein
MAADVAAHQAGIKIDAAAGSAGDIDGDRAINGVGRLRRGALRQMQ